MRFTKNIDGVSRIIKSNTYKPSHKEICYPKNTQQSQDTIIRRNINETIFKMVAEKKGDIEIEIYLTNLYPTYDEYIRKMISNYFAKINRKTSRETGEER